MSTVRVGLAGLGVMGKTHLGVYRRLPEVEVVAVCDAIAERLSTTRLEAGGNIDASSGEIDLSGARKYRDFDSMIADGGFDIVDLCLPTVVHAPFSIRALEAGFHVFCEKPMALTGEECDRVLAAVERTGRQYGVGHCLRFWPAYTEVKRLIDSGRYGKIRYAEYARFSAPPVWGSDNWLLDGKRSGNAALDLHIHDADMVLYIHGLPKSLRSRGIVEADGSVSQITTLYTYDDAVVVATGGWLCSDSFGFNMRALWVLERATIELDFSKQPNVMLYPRGGKKEPLPLPEGDGYYHELVDFTERVATGRGPGAVTGKSSAEAVKLCRLEERSAVEGRELPVRL